MRIRAVASPGHRPEHLAFAVCDLSRGHEPWLLLTGDSLLVGDIARPDLAYEAADGAHALYATLRGLTGSATRSRSGPPTSADRCAAATT